MIFIKGNVPSSKNSKVKTSRGVFHSATVKKYIRNLGIMGFSPTKKTVEFYKTRKCTFPIEELLGEFENVEYPVKVGFHFVRGTKHKFDFHNVVQIIADLMVAFDVIEDDNMDYFIPVPFKIKGNYYSYSKDNPGVYIKLY